MSNVEAVKHSCQIASAVLKQLCQRVRPGITTEMLDEFAAQAIEATGGQPSFKDYKNYPRSMCVSVNQEIIHGIPGDRQLQMGDVVSLDLGVCWEGSYSDIACTVAIPPFSEAVAYLIEHTRKALYTGIEKARSGNHIGDISYAIQTYVESKKLAVIRDYVGHGIGQARHEPPQIPNYGEQGTGPLIEAGMILCIEPMVTQGTEKIKILPDRWTAVTADGSLAAHFEHTVLITERGPEVLTTHDD